MLPLFDHRLILVGQFMTNSAVFPQPPAIQATRQPAPVGARAPGAVLAMRAFHLLLVTGLPLLAREPLAKRIAHTDPAQYRLIKSVHAGAHGGLNYVGSFDAYAFNTNLIFLHRGVIPPKGGIGHHYHDQMEEMFVIFDNEAEFTIDGRTSRLDGPAGATCRMGRSHGIYNPTDRPTEWMTIAVGSVKGKYDATDLADNRVGVPLDPKPVFIRMKLDRKLLQPVDSMNGSGFMLSPFL